MADVTRWRLAEEIARGGAGVVWLAYDTQQDRKVAVKFVDARTLAGQRARRRFLREGQVLTRLEHPNIMRVHEVGGDDAPYIVMDYVPNGSLEDRLEREGRLEVRDAVHVACQMALGLDHAHQAQVVHRDLKPGNVLLRDDGEPLITDFGLAKELDSSQSDTGITTRGHSMGTPGYWSPEQATGKTELIGPATDVYGLGGTLYAMLTGQPPHEGATLLQVFEAMDRGPVSPRKLRPEIDAELERICLKSLARDPAQRYPSAKAMAGDLERWLNAVQEESIAEDKLETSCPVCGRAIVVPASYEGRRGRCPGCKRVLRIRPGTAAVSLQLTSGSQSEAAAAAVIDPGWRWPALGGLVVAAVAGVSAWTAGGSGLAIALSAAFTGPVAAGAVRWSLPRTSARPPARAPDGLVETIRARAVDWAPKPTPGQPNPLEQAIRYRPRGPDRNA